MYCFITIRHEKKDERKKSAVLASGTCLYLQYKAALFVKKWY